MAKALHYRDSKIDMKYCFELSSLDYDTFTKQLLFSNWQFSFVEPHTTAESRLKY